MGTLSLSDPTKSGWGLSANKVRGSGLMGLICEDCGKEYVYKRSAGHTFKRCNSCQSNRRRRERKQQVVSYLGGKCIVCGYSLCIEALEVHHVDPQNKSFTISGNHARSLSSVKKELDKCVLLCANCHRELHAGLIKLPIG